MTKFYVGLKDCNTLWSGPHDTERDAVLEAQAAGLLGFQCEVWSEAGGCKTILFETPRG